MGIYVALMKHELYGEMSFTKRTIETVGSSWEHNVITFMVWLSSSFFFSIQLEDVSLL